MHRPDVCCSAVSQVNAQFEAKNDTDMLWKPTLLRGTTEPIQISAQLLGVFLSPPPPEFIFLYVKDYFSIHSWQEIKFSLSAVLQSLCLMPPAYNEHQ